MIKHFISRIVEKEDLLSAESAQLMEIILSGQATSAQIAAVMVGFKMKPETIAEITGMVKTMRKFCVQVNGVPKNLVDTCGTGGDLSNTFNISTVAAFVASGAGVNIAKHGNRSVSSRCGSADVLEALGINIMLGAEQVRSCLNELGIAFFFAPLFHPAMKNAIEPRKDLSIRSFFNILGPLTNPAGATGHVLGVYSDELTRTLAQVLRNLGTKRAFIVHGVDGLDEISISGKTKVSEIKPDGKIITYCISPEDFEIPTASLSTVIGGTPAINAQIMENILLNKETGARRDIVLLNAAAAIIVGNKADTFTEAINLARESIESGSAGEKLIKLRELSNKLTKKSGKTVTVVKSAKLPKPDKRKTPKSKKVKAGK